MLVGCSTDGSEEESAAPSEATSSETETGGVASTPDEWRAAMEAAAEDDVAIELCGAIFADDGVARAAMEYVPVVKTAGGHSTSQGGQDIAVCSIDTDRDHGDALLAVMVAGLGAELLDSGVSFDDELCPPLEEGSVDHGTEGDLHWTLGGGEGRVPSATLTTCWADGVHRMNIDVMSHKPEGLPDPSMLDSPDYLLELGQLLTDSRDSWMPTVASSWE